MRKKQKFALITLKTSRNYQKFKKQKIEKGEKVTFAKLRRSVCSQEEFAKAIGVDQTTVSKWETGKSKPRVGELSKIAKVCGVTVDKLLESFE